MERLEYAAANVLTTKAENKYNLEKTGKEAKKFLRHSLKKTECCSFNTFNSMVLACLGANLLYLDVSQVDGTLRQVFKILYMPGRANSQPENPTNTGNLVRLSDLYAHVSSEELYPQSREKIFALEQI